MSAIWDYADVLYETDACCIECGCELDLLMLLDADDELCQSCVDEQLTEPWERL